MKGGEGARPGLPLLKPAHDSRWLFSPLRSRAGEAADLSDADGNTLLAHLDLLAVEAVGLRVTGPQVGREGLALDVVGKAFDGLSQLAGRLVDRLDGVLDLQARILARVLHTADEVARHPFEPQLRRDG